MFRQQVSRLETFNVLHNHIRKFISSILENRNIWIESQLKIIQTLLNQLYKTLPMVI